MVRGIGECRRKRRRTKVRSVRGRGGEVRVRGIVEGKAIVTNPTRLVDYHGSFRRRTQSHELALTSFPPHITTTHEHKTPNTLLLFFLSLILTYNSYNFWWF